MDGCCYHPKYLKTLFGQVSSRMTDFISLKLGIEKTKAKEIQQEYFYKYDTSLNGLMKNYPDLINGTEFLKYVHNINYDCIEKDMELREELLKLDVKTYCATNGSKEHAINCMKKIGIDDLFEGKIMDIVDFKFIPKPNAESLKLMCDKFQIPTNEETVYIEDIAKNLSIAKIRGSTTVWLINDEYWGKKESDKDYIDYKIENLSLFLKEIRLLKKS